MQADAEKIVRAFEGPGFAIFQHMQRINHAYIDLTNAVDAAAAKAALKELKLAAADCERLIRGVLYREGCPQALILKVNDIALRVWTLDSLSGLLVNCMHYLARFVHTPTQPGKVKELTSLYSLIKDLAECSLEVREESYRRELS